MTARFLAFAMFLGTAACSRGNPRFGADGQSSGDGTGQDTGSDDQADGQDDSRSTTTGEAGPSDDSGTTGGGRGETDAAGTTATDTDAAGDDSGFVVPKDVGTTRKPGPPCIETAGGLNCWDFDDVTAGMWVNDQVGDAVLASDEALSFVSGLFGTALDCREPNPCSLQASVGPPEAWTLEVWFDASAGGMGWSTDGSLVDLINDAGSQVQIRATMGAAREVVMSFNGQGPGFLLPDDAGWLCAAIRHGVSDTTFELYDSDGLVGGAPATVETATLGNNDFTDGTLIIGAGGPGANYDGFVDGLRLRDELSGGACTPL